jgi:hypothetical protein
MKTIQKCDSPGNIIMQKISACEKIIERNNPAEFFARLIVVGNVKALKKEHMLKKICGSM